MSTKTSALTFVELGKCTIAESFSTMEIHDSRAHGQGCSAHGTSIFQAQQASPVRTKQLYVLAALEVERARDLNERELVQSHGLTLLGGGIAAGNTTMNTIAQNTLQGLVTQDLVEGRVCCDTLCAFTFMLPRATGDSNIVAYFRIVYASAGRRIDGQSLARS